MGFGYPGSRAIANNYLTCVIPPSTISSAPVVKDESSEAMNNTAFATSSGSPILFMGTVVLMNSKIGSEAFSSATLRLMIDVAVGPGETLFTRIPSGKSSAAQHWTIERKAALVALYTDDPAPPKWLTTEVVTTIEEPFCNTGKAF